MAVKHPVASRASAQPIWLLEAKSRWELVQIGKACGIDTTGRGTNDLRMSILQARGCDLQVVVEECERRRVAEARAKMESEELNARWRGFLEELPAKDRRKYSTIEQPRSQGAHWSAPSAHDGSTAEKGGGGRSQTGF